MESVLVTAGITAGAALLGSAAGAFGGPWAQWSIEKKRNREARRAALVLEWRRGIAQLAREASGAERTLPEFGTYRDTDWYQSLHAYLSDPEGISEPSHTVVRSRQGSGPGRVLGKVDRLRAEVDRIERDWGLA